MADPKLIFLAFVAAINGGQADKVGAMMSSDHVFIDSLGNRVGGAAKMIGGWRGYFAMFPDYNIEVDQVAVEGSTVLGTGWASGTLHREGRAVGGSYWRIPAAWRAKIRNDKVWEWQVYADNKPVYELLAPSGGK